MRSWFSGKGPDNSFGSVKCGRGGSGVGGRTPPGCGVGAIDAECEGRGVIEPGAKLFGGAGVIGLGTKWLIGADTIGPGAAGEDAAGAPTGWGAIVKRFIASREMMATQP